MQRRAAVLAALARRLAGARSALCEPAASSAPTTPTPPIAWSSPPSPLPRPAALVAPRSFATAAPALKVAVDGVSTNTTNHLPYGSVGGNDGEGFGRHRTSSAGAAAAAPDAGPPLAAAASFVDKEEDHADDSTTTTTTANNNDESDFDSDDFDEGGSSSSSSSGLDPLTAALRAASLDDAARAALTPAEIVRRLDEHVVGQSAAKRAVAVALRNRWRRQRLADEHRREVAPRGLLLVGPTGSGKTEIARRLAKLGDAPFVATSATRYTELGYVGADVEDMVKELAEEALRLTKRRVRDALRKGAEARAERAIVRALCGPRAPAATVADFTRLYREGALDELPVSAEALSSSGVGVEEDQEEGLGDEAAAASSSSSSRPATTTGRPRRRSSSSSSSTTTSTPPTHHPLPPTPSGGPTLRVADAREALLERDVARRLDASAPLLQREALRLAAEEGIIFIDEIDKIVEPGAAQRAAAGREGGGGWATGGGGGGRGGGVSSEGVQRDLLPILEGTVVPTKLGPLDTTHVLFVCAGAFHQARPSDMLGELQGRLPVRVELGRMSQRDLLRVLTEPKHSLKRQHEALLRAEGIELRFTEGALKAVARCAAEANRLLDDLGARRLGTVLERVLRTVSYEAPALVAQAKEQRRQRVGGLGVGGGGGVAGPDGARAAVESGKDEGDGDDSLVPYVVDEADVERAMAEVLAVPDLSRHML